MKLFGDDGGYQGLEARKEYSLFDAITTTNLRLEQAEAKLLAIQKLLDSTMFIRTSKWGRETYAILNEKSGGDR